MTSPSRTTTPPGPDPAPVISLDRVTVDLPIYNARGRSLRLAMLDLAVGGRLAGGQSGTVVVRALDGISFQVCSGERIGLLGHNGSGKTTLLKLLSGILCPTLGNIDRRVPVMPLLDMSLGVDDEMTGLEAIRIGCMLRGVPFAALPSTIQEIAEFTELGDFLSLPIRTYSAGMRARIAFATATCRRPEALAIDESIGAGDAQFLGKAQARTHSFIQGASVLFLASHQDSMLRDFCTRGIVMRHGRIEYQGAIDEAIQYYDGGKYSGLPVPPAAASGRKAA